MLRLNKDFKCTKLGKFQHLFRKHITYKIYEVNILHYMLSINCYLPWVGNNEFLNSIMNSFSKLILLL